jgi:acetyl esterase/lipase
MILTYLGCASADEGKCPQSADASALSDIDSTDPPALLFNSDNELVPKEQAQSMHDALAQAGITSELTIVPGTQHGVQLLNQQNREQLFAFLDSTLA